MTTATGALTFEDIDRHLKSIDLSEFQTGGKHFLSAEAVRANPAIALPNVCPAFRAIRPILVAIAALPFIPQNWTSAVSTFTGVMDAVCPAAKGKAS